jgi:hypothetical protein
MIVSEASITIKGRISGGHTLEFSNFLAGLYEKLENPLLYPFRSRPGRLLVRHSFPKSALLCLLAHGTAVNVAHLMLPQLSLSRNFRELRASPL